MNDPRLSALGDELGSDVCGCTRAGQQTTAGIDFDTNAVHVVLLREDGSAEYHHFALTGQDAFERTRGVREAMPARDWWRDEGVVACALEEPQGVQKATVAKLKAVQGAVLACLPADLLVEPWVPARWRREAGLGGGVNKEIVRLKVAADQFDSGRDWGMGEWPQDACDAYCLALAVSTLWEKAA